MRHGVEKRSYEQFGRPDITRLWDYKNQREYRRISGGIAWPIGDKPGCVLVLAEDLNRHARMKKYIYRVLDEFSSREAEKLVKRMYDFEAFYAVSPWYGDDENALSLFFVDRFNNGLPVKKKGLSIVGAAFAGSAGNLKLYSNLIYSRLGKAKKTLYFGKSTLPGELGALSAEDIEGKAAENYPPIAALGYAVMGLDEPFIDTASDQIVHQQYIDRVTVEGI